MSDGLWMPLYIGDYLKDTGHLTAAEHGGYLLLLMHAWTHNGVLENDDFSLRATARLDSRDWKRSRDRLLAFFFLTKEGYRHKRIEQELAVSRAKSAQRSVAGKASAEQRQRQREGNGRSTGVQRELNGKVNETPTAAQRQSNINTTQSVESKLLLESQLPRTRVAKPVPKRTYGGLEEHVSTDHTGRPVVNGTYLDGATDNVLHAARISATSWPGNNRPLIKWLADGYEEPHIVATIERIAKRDGYNPPATLAYFDKPIRSAEPTWLPNQGKFGG